MKEKLKENWKEYLVIGLIGLWIVAFAVIFYASAQAGCSENEAFRELEGLCLLRRIAGLSCYAGYLGLWTYLGGLVAKGKGRHPAIGWLLGFTLEFMGCFFMMMWEPRRDDLGRMIGWDEYKHLTVEEWEAIRPPPIPLSPEMKRRRVIVIVIAIVLVIVFALSWVFTEA